MRTTSKCQCCNIPHVSIDIVRVVIIFRLKKEQSVALHTALSITQQRQVIYTMIQNHYQ